MFHWLLLGRPYTFCICYNIWTRGSRCSTSKIDLKPIVGLTTCNSEAHDSLFWSIIYNRAIVYKRHIFLKVVVHVFIVDQCNQTAS